MIYTSYFAKLKSLPNNIVPISICGKAPDWYEGLQYKKLAPKWEFFKKWKENHDNDYYVKCFNEQVLDKLNATDVILDFSRLSYDYNIGEKDICLICYEKPSDEGEDFFCIYDSCRTELEPEFIDKNGIGRVLTCIGFKPFEESYIDKIGKKFHLYI